MVVKPFNIVAVLVFLLSVFVVFQVGYKVRNLQKDLQEVDRQIAYENDSLHVLRAEWSYLNHPDRLRHLSSQYLDMRNMTLAQIDSFPELEEGQSFHVSYDREGDIDIRSVGHGEDSVHLATKVR